MELRVEDLPCTIRYDIVYMITIKSMMILDFSQKLIGPRPCLGNIFLHIIANRNEPCRIKLVEKSKKLLRLPTLCT
jgi:hypothetical protein